MNEKWIFESNQRRYDLEEGLPVNPPGGHYTEDDIYLPFVEIGNWVDKHGEYVFKPRLRDKLQLARQITAVDEDLEYDCD